MLLIVFILIFIKNLVTLYRKKKLYSTKYIILSNLYCLTNDNFIALFEVLRNLQSSFLNRTEMLSNEV